MSIIWKNRKKENEDKEKEGRNHAYSVNFQNNFKFCVTPNSSQVLEAEGKTALPLNEIKKMVVGIGQIQFRLYDVHSLKAKRSVVKPIISRLQNRFNISVAETGLNDSHDWAQIGFALVGNDARLINSKVDKVFNAADRLGLAVIVDTQMEIIHI